MWQWCARWHGSKQRGWIFATCELPFRKAAPGGRLAANQRATVRLHDRNSASTSATPAASAGERPQATALPGGLSPWIDQLTFLLGTRVTFLTVICTVQRQVAEGIDRKVARPQRSLTLLRRVPTVETEQASN
jgi:hypothetical protein